MISDTAIWTTVALLGAATYAIRFSFLGLLAGRKLPPWAEEALHFVPVTVLPALILPMILYAPEGEGWAEPHRWLAALVALAVGIGTGKMFLTVLAGLTAFAGLRALGL
ncbi:MAG: AzlD domain-containing protein [Pseudomonadota bacterium]